MRHPFVTVNWYGYKETYTHKYVVANILSEKDEKKINGKNQTLLGELFVSKTENKKYLSIPLSSLT